MSIIQVNHLTFSYEGSLTPLFSDVTFTLDTDWRLGFIGRNGRGKTTFLRLLMGDFPYQGSIQHSVDFAYFPFSVSETTGSTLTTIRNIIAPFDAWEEKMLAASRDPARMDEYGKLLELFLQHDGYTINEAIEKELAKLEVRAEVLSRPFATLSHGERTKLLLAALFLRKNAFLLIDEPTNHLDIHGREVLARYLKSKKGFILVSHDRVFLDETIDHVLSLNRSSIEVQQGSFSSWQENKQRRDAFELEENEKLKKEIGRLEKAARQKAEWSDAVERTKIGQHVYDRGAVGHKAAKMMARSKDIEQRVQRSITDKSALLHDIEQSDAIKLVSLTHHKERLLDLREVSIAYGESPILEHITFSVSQGQRVALAGPNGSGKSSLLKLALGQDIPHTGEVQLAGGLILSYVPQDTSFLRGDLRTYLRNENLDETLVKSLLRKLDFSREQFETPLERYSAGQKKKLLLAASLSTQAHLYLWDEPLNYIDVLSRIQIEDLILAFSPTLLFVEHDRMFVQRVATDIVQLDGGNL